jgi:hypothetical protein
MIYLQPLDEVRPPPPGRGPSPPTTSVKIEKKDISNPIIVSANLIAARLIAGATCSVVASSWRREL